ncbi:MAG: hexokinase [Rikenellaceae bacterium]|jgi:hexokinase|nr:hexokinase [Rikenellaceae bacterium]
MKKNSFELSAQQLMQIATTLQDRIKEGLQKENQEVLCIPTYINPRKDVKNEKVLVLDLGGTNCRVAVVEFTNGKPAIHPDGGWKKELAPIMKRPGCTQEELFQEIADMLSTLDLKGVDSIGYCFSYPAGSTLDGDATLLRWTKGVNIPEMIGKPIGHQLMDYLNKALKGKAAFKNVKVINDTVASLFAGLTDTAAQAHIGLIVGTGTNMAAFFSSTDIPKLDKGYKQKGLIPVNLESGNFMPPFLSPVDDKIDRYSDNRGSQRFEKAISGMYLGRILEYVFSTDEFEENFDAAKLTRIMSYPDMYKENYVEWAHRIYERSAKLVAASLAGLVLEMVACDPKIKNIRLTAEGSLFWSSDKKGKYCYKELTMATLADLLDAFGLKDVTVSVDHQDNANLIGSAIAGLS